MTIQDRIRALREEGKKHITQSELGEALHKSQKAISRLETGEVHLIADDIIAYCKLFNVSADYILGLPKDMNYPER